MKFNGGVGLSLIPSVLGLGLIGFNSCSSRPSRAEAATTKLASMGAAAWNILYSASMAAHPNAAVDGGWYFDFPSCDGANTCFVGYVMVPVNLSASTSVRAVFQITTTGTPAFHYKLEAHNTCDYPAHVRYILQRKGDDLYSEFYRWFSVSGFKLEEGHADLTVPLAPDKWVSVFGKRGDYNESAQTGFHQALQNLGNVGFVYGGGCFYSHGVNVIGGSARFLATEYAVK